MEQKIFVGIDISKDSLDVGISSTGEVFREPHEARGIRAVMKRLSGLRPSLIVLEATGGYEIEIWTAL
jgi:transposase